MRKSRLTKVKKIITVGALCLCFTMPTGVVHASSFPGSDSTQQNQDTQQGQDTQQSQQSSDSQDWSVDSILGEDDVKTDDGASSFFKGFTPLTKGNMQQANKNTGWLQNVFGNLIGIGLVILTLFQGAITIADLFAITVPATRAYLQGGNSKGRQYVSDEAIKAIAGAGSGSPAGGQSGGLNGGLNGGFGGGLGGGLNGGLQGTNQSSQSNSQGGGAKLTIFTYFKYRIIAIIFVVASAIILTSSILMDCGVNIAALFIRILANFVA